MDDGSNPEEVSRSVRWIGVAALWIGLFASGVAAAHPPDTTRPMLLETPESKALLDEGRAHMWAFRLDPAERVFRRLADRSDGKPAAYHHLAMVALLRGSVTDSDAHFQTFFERSDTLRTLLDERPESVWQRELEAETTLQRVLAAGKLGRYIRAALAARSAFRQFEALLEDHSDFNEAYLGMGLLHLTVGSLPAGWRNLLEWLGFSGTVTEGLGELQRAAERSHYNRQQAQVLLALADVILNQEVGRGAERLGRLYNERSESLLYAHLYGFALFRHREAARAKSVLRAAIEQSGPRYFYINYLDYYLAEVLFVQDQFDEAASRFRQYLDRHEGPALRAMARYRLGLALEMQGRRPAAVKWYKQVKTERDFDSDMYARRWAQKRLDAPMDSLDRQVLLGENAFRSGRYDRAERILRAVHGHDEATAAHRAEAAFYLGRLYHVQERYGRAYPAYLFAVQNPGDPDAQWGPWAQLHIGTMRAEQGQIEEAIQAYERAMDYEPGYDYAQSLEQTARVALEQLRERAKATPKK